MAEKAFINTSLDPLPDDIRRGMIAMGLFGLASTISTFSLISFITYRMIYWRRYYDAPIHKNQVFVLIYNLLLADFQQALSFVMSFHWLAQGKLVGPNSLCFAQGWLIQIGDMSSGLWVLSIAVHTFINLVAGKQIRHRPFVACVVALWAFCLFLTAIGPILSKDDFFVPAGAWCWISNDHESERLYLHYLWIFISQLGSLVIYMSVFFSLRGRLGPSPSTLPANSQFSANDPTNTQDFKHVATTTTTIMSPSNNAFAVSRQRILRTARYMVVYPFAYVALTLPLAAARVSSMTGKTPPLVFFPVAGTLMASCGITDVLLYISTRKALVKSSVGMKGSGYSENSNALRRFKTGEENRQTSGGIGLERMGSEEIMAGNGTPLRSIGGMRDIVVSQTVEMSAEGSVEEEGRLEGGSVRSDSMRSLMRKKDDEEEDFEGARKKDWPLDHY